MPTLVEDQDQFTSPLLDALGMSLHCLTVPTVCQNRHVTTMRMQVSFVGKQCNTVSYINI